MYFLKFISICFIKTIEFSAWKWSRRSYMLSAGVPGRPFLGCLHNSTTFLMVEKKNALLGLAVDVLYLIVKKL